MAFTASALIGRTVRLDPLLETHREELRPVADDERIWTHMLSVASGAGFDAWFDEALTQAQRIPFVVRSLRDGRLVGSTSYLDVNERHRRVEIGSTWYHPDVWATAVNPECKLLLLAHAFEVFAVNRVSFVTDVRNERSRAAIAKLGAVQEGILRSHMVTQGDRVRDSVLFSITAAEWPTVRERLTARVASLEG
jgi:RimJ/RimL family protein N-acetyltransferase